MWSINYLKDGLGKAPFGNRRRGLNPSLSTWKLDVLTKYAHAGRCWNSELFGSNSSFKRILGYEDRNADVGDQNQRWGTHAERVDYSLRLVVQSSRLAGGNKPDEFDLLVGGVGADQQETVEPAFRELPPGPPPFPFLRGMV